MCTNIESLNSILADVLFYMDHCSTSTVSLPVVGLLILHELRESKKEWQEEMKLIKNELVKLREQFFLAETVLEDRDVVSTYLQETNSSQEPNENADQDQSPARKIPRLSDDKSYNTGSKQVGKGPVKTSDKLGPGISPPSYNSLPLSSASQGKTVAESVSKNSCLATKTFDALSIKLPSEATPQRSTTEAVISPTSKIVHSAKKSLFLISREDRNIPSTAKQATSSSSHNVPSASIKHSSSQNHSNSENELESRKLQYPAESSKMLQDDSSSVVSNPPPSSQKSPSKNVATSLVEGFSPLNSRSKSSASESNALKVPFDSPVKLPSFKKLSEVVSSTSVSNNLTKNFAKTSVESCAKLAPKKHAPEVVSSSHYNQSNVKNVQDFSTLNSAMSPTSSSSLFSSMVLKTMPKETSAILSSNDTAPVFTMPSNVISVTSSNHGHSLLPKTSTAAKEQSMSSAAPVDMTRKRSASSSEIGIAPSQHHNQPSKPIKCRICNKVFTQRNEAITHLRIIHKTTVPQESPIFDRLLL